MTGAAAGHIEPGTPPSEPRADVVDLHTRRRSGRKTSRRAPGTVKAAPQSVEETTRQTFAINIEALFLGRNVSLTDPETVAALDASMDAVQLLIDGAHAVGQLPSECRQLMSEQVAYLRAVPGSL